MLNAHSYEHYQRHIQLRNFGVRSQELLATHSVLIVGVGGLGCPLALQVVASGVGRVGLVDHDTIELSNLPRQTLFGVDDRGKSKVTRATEVLTALNPDCHISPVRTTVDATNALELCREYDIIVDATDNFATRYCLNDACVLLDKPLVFAAVDEYSAQISCFNVLQSDGTRSGTLRCLFPTPPDPAGVRSCDEVGILGLTTQLVGTMMASQVIGLITAATHVFANALLTVDVRHMTTQLFSYSRNENLWTNFPRDERSFRVMRYNEVCGSPEDDTLEFRVDVAKRPLDLRSATFIDIREEHERMTHGVQPAVHIPLSQLSQRSTEVPQEGLVLLVCATGKRSLRQVREWHSNQQMTHVKSLHGGLSTWLNIQDQESARHD